MDRMRLEDHITLIREERYKSVMNETNRRGSDTQAYAFILSLAPDRTLSQF